MSPDYFSAQASDYAQSRPSYPDELFEFLAALTPSKHFVLDCATGNGQAALSLAQHFDDVFAADLSFNQLKQAPSHPNIHYFQSTAESLPLKDQSMNLVVVAQAWHWFKHEAFEAEAQRLLTPGGHVAIWGYNLLRIHPALDELIYHYYHQTLKNYWPDERRILERGYEAFPQHLQVIPVPEFSMTAQWSLARLLQYLRSWSATQALLGREGEAPWLAMEEVLSQAWGNAPIRNVQWPLTLKVARHPLLPHQRP